MPARKNRTATLHGLKALTDEGPGIFSAIVAVFGNVDFGGDRIIPGFFAKSLERWAASGDPIPVIFSHQWDDLDAHVGAVLEAKELLAGAPELVGTGLEANGGLWTKFKLDVEDPDETAARRLAKRLTDRRIKEFSFAYDVVEERRGTDGVNELVEGELIEVGPTLKGMNPATVLLAKALGGDVDEVEDLTADELLERLAKAVADRSTKAQVSVTFDGAIEAELEDVFVASLEWARGGDIGNGGFYSIYLEATFPEEKRAIVLVEGMDDPFGEGLFYELSYDRDETGKLSVSDPHEIEVVVETVRKSRAMKHRRPGSAIAVKGSDTFEPTKPKGKAEDRESGKVEDPRAETPTLDPSIVALELAELGMI